MYHSFKFISDSDLSELSSEVEILGVEVTKLFAEKCSLGNIDPRHQGQEDKAAIEVALNMELPAPRITLATTQPDLDSVGAMAVLDVRSDYEWAWQCDPNVPVGQYGSYGSKVPFYKGSDELKRLQLVVEADKFTHGLYPGPSPLPSREKAWLNAAPAGSIKELAAINAAVADPAIPLEQRVEWMGRWLLFGKEPEGYREKVEKERQDYRRNYVSSVCQYCGMDQFLAPGQMKEGKVSLKNVQVGPGQRYPIGERLSVVLTAPCEGCGGDVQFLLLDIAEDENGRLFRCPM